MTTEPYRVTPAESHYEVDFEFAVPAELAGKVLTGLTLSMEQKRQSDVPRSLLGGRHVHADGGGLRAK